MRLLDLCGNVTCNRRKGFLLSERYSSECGSECDSATPLVSPAHILSIQHVVLQPLLLTPLPLPHPVISYIYEKPHALDTLPLYTYLPTQSLLGELLY